MNACGHRLCEMIDTSCSIATNRSRGCRPNLVEKTANPVLLDEVRSLVATIDPAVHDDGMRAMAIRLAEIVRREALDERPLLAYARIDEPELVPALERLLVRRR